MPLSAPLLNLEDESQAPLGRRGVATPSRMVRKRTSSSVKRLQNWIVGGLAALAAIFGSALFAESFTAPAGCCLATWPNPNPVQVERLLSARDPAGRDAGAQEVAAQEVLAARPVDSSGWMRLAYADALRNGRLSPSGLNALRTSYVMSAYAGRNAGWRLAFALQHWDELDSDTKQQAMIELKALQKDGLRLAAAKQQISAVSNPAGRALAAMNDLLPPVEPQLRR
jgi:hypothetical protein